MKAKTPKYIYTYWSGKYNLGAVRYALGAVQDPKSYNGKEWMPRKYAGKKSIAYWTALKAGLEIAA